MTKPHINETASKAQPREAAIGELSDDTTVEGLTEALGAAGIEADRLYFLIGKEGAAALEKTRGFFSVFDDVIEKPMGALNEGKTLVGVFGVEKDDAEAMRHTLVDAGVVRTHYFGKWSYY